jgi:hypothetical protein
MGFQMKYVVGVMDVMVETNVLRIWQCQSEQEASTVLA